jgi:hypothetical protein
MNVLLLLGFGILHVALVNAACATRNSVNGLCITCPTGYYGKYCDTTVNPTAVDFSIYDMIFFWVTWLLWMLAIWAAFYGCGTARRVSKRAAEEQEVKPTPQEAVPQTQASAEQPQASSASDDRGPTQAASETAPVTAEGGSQENANKQKEEGTAEGTPAQTASSNASAPPPAAAAESSTQEKKAETTSSTNNGTSSSTRETRAKSPQPPVRQPIHVPARRDSTTQRQQPPQQHAENPQQQSRAFTSVASTGGGVTHGTLTTQSQAPAAPSLRGTGKAPATTQPPTRRESEHARHREPLPTRSVSMSDSDFPTQQRSVSRDPYAPIFAPSQSVASRSYSQPPFAAFHQNHHNDPYTHSESRNTQWGETPRPRVRELESDRDRERDREPSGASMKEKERSSRATPPPKDSKTTGIQTSEVVETQRQKSPSPAVTRERSQGTAAIIARLSEVARYERSPVRSRTLARHEPKFVEGDAIRRNHFRPDLNCNFGGLVGQVLCGERVVVSRCVTHFSPDPIEGSIPHHYYFVEGGEIAPEVDIEPLFTVDCNVFGARDYPSSSVAAGGSTPIQQSNDEDDDAPSLSARKVSFDSSTR